MVFYTYGQIVTGYSRSLKITPLYIQYIHIRIHIRMSMTTKDDPRELGVDLEGSIGEGGGS